ncbi:putative exonuclease, DNA ligase-associated [Tepidimonas thermarum]|uniref:Putative exonuclease, DNA ligase-associated n=1 Tax=Tepidimonas thermarum TaxID=335431 RepID=A0A554WW53_9BURK|nr:ligase-associated DNA damage response exonuclease [Tepidimonas thermarum]TSE27806.1 putative exonuclease, DNA ligase-associated [Tepidimonas thermarum]
MTDSGALVVLRPQGLYCPAGDFFIDPWRPVARAVITHAHADHARRGHGAYLAHRDSAGVLRARLGADIALQTVDYGAPVTCGNVRVSLHPAGHVLGSAQVRLEHRGEVWVVSGDYKVEADTTCTPFEPVRCHTFITESTFGLPLYRWRPQVTVFDDIRAWWQANATAGRASVLYAYALGKAQRLLAGLGTAPIGPIVVHGAVETINQAYRAAGVALPATQRWGDGRAPAEGQRALVIAPPSAQGSPGLRRLGPYADAMVSGWMQLRGTRRRRGVDRGFALSDHADWPGLLQAIGASGAQRVLVTHGQVAPLVRYLKEQGLQADALQAHYRGEDGADAFEDEAP